MQTQRVVQMSSEVHGDYPLLHHLLQSSKFPLEVTSAQELRGLMKWLPWSEGCIQA